MLKKDLSILEDIYKGIGQSSAAGFEDIRNLDITSQPGMVSLNFDTTALTLPPTVSALAFTSNAANNTLTVASTSGWYNGMALTLNTVVTSTGIVTGRVYWVGDLSGNTFKLYKGPHLGATSVTDVTGGDGSGTLSSYTFSSPVDTAYSLDIAQSRRGTVLILDDNGRLWGVNNFTGTLYNNLVYLGNDNNSIGNGKAVVCFGTDDIVVFRSSAFDVLDSDALYTDGFDLDSVSGWDYGVDTVSTIFVPRRATLVSRDGNLYFDNSDRLGKLDSSYTKTVSALDLPNNEDVTDIAELGRYLLISNEANLIYPWNKSSPSFEDPIIVPERGITRLVSTGQLAYVFAGNSGKIYVTNGLSINEYKKIPDQITGQKHPLITWVDAIAHDNQLVFSFSATKNDGTVLTTVGGVWAIDLVSKALRLIRKLSYGSYAGGTALLSPNVLDTDSFGDELIIAWANSTTYGVDTGSTSYYDDYAAYAIGPVYTLGTPHNKESLTQLDIILAEPLASGEGVRVSYRGDRSSSFSDPITFDEAGKSYKSFDLPAIDLVTCQFKVEVTGSTTTPIIKDILAR
jgi:hypothetical protein